MESVDDDVAATCILVGDEKYFRLYYGQFELREVRLLAVATPQRTIAVRKRGEIEPDFPVSFFLYPQQIDLLRQGIRVATCTQSASLAPHDPAASLAGKGHWSRSGADMRASLFLSIALREQTAHYAPSLDPAGPRGKFLNIPDWCACKPASVPLWPIGRDPP